MKSLISVLILCFIFTTPLFAGSKPDDANWASVEGVTLSSLLYKENGEIISTTPMGNLVIILVKADSGYYKWIEQYSGGMNVRVSSVRCQKLLPVVK